MLLELLEKTEPNLELNFEEDELSFELTVSLLLIVDVGDGVLSVDSSPSILGVRPSADVNDVVVLFFFEVVRGVGRGSDFEVFLSIR